MKLRNKRTGAICIVNGSYADRTKGTVRIYLADSNKRPVSDAMLPEIMKDYEVVEEPKTVWDLRIGDAYYIPDWDDQVGFDTWLDRPKDLMRRTMGNVFLTKQEAEKELARRKARQVLLRDTKGFKPSIGNYFHYVYYNYGSRELRMAYHTGTNLYDQLAFATEEDVRASINAHPQEWKTYLGVEE